jgi:hypothetical protein
MLFPIMSINYLLNIGATPGQKVRPPRCLGQELPLLLVQSSFAKRYLVNAILAKACAVVEIVIISGSPVFHGNVLPVVPHGWFPIALLASGISQQILESHYYEIHARRRSLRGQRR